MTDKQQLVENAERFARIETNIEHIFEAIKSVIKSVNEIKKNSRVWLLMLIPSILILVNILVQFLGN